MNTIVSSLNKLHTKLDGINEEISAEKVGIKAKLKVCEGEIESLIGDTESIQFEVNICKGVLHRQGDDYEHLNRKVTDINIRQMADNITISGILYNQFDADSEEEQPRDKNDTTVKEENCSKMAETFFKEMMKIEVKEGEIKKAHRIGPEEQNRSRLMVVSCAPELKDRVLTNSKVLSGKKNPLDRPYFVNQQLPEELIAQRKDVSHAIKKIRETNQGKPLNLKKKFNVKRRVLYVDGQPVKKVIYPPKVNDLFVQKGEQDKTTKLKLWFSEPHEESGSVFTAVAAKVSGPTEIRRAYRKVKQLYPGANHIVLGYDCQKQQGNQDDGEHSAGLCIQKVIEEQGVNNKAVFVVRNFGGKRLGPKRFNIIQEVVKEVLAKIK